MLQTNQENDTYLLLIWPPAVTLKCQVFFPFWAILKRKLFYLRGHFLTPCGWPCDLRGWNVSFFAILSNFKKKSPPQKNKNDSWRWPCDPGGQMLEGFFHSKYFEKSFFPGVILWPLWVTLWPQRVKCKVFCHSNFFLIPAVTVSGFFFNSEQF